MAYFQCLGEQQVLKVWMNSQIQHLFVRLLVNASSKVICFETYLGKASSHTKKYLIRLWRESIFSENFWLRKALKRGKNTLFFQQETCKNFTLCISKLYTKYRLDIPKCMALPHLGKSKHTSRLFFYLHLEREKLSGCHQKPASPHVTVI